MVGQLIMLAQEGGGAEGCGDGSGDGQADQVIGAVEGLGCWAGFSSSAGRMMTMVPGLSGVGGSISPVAGITSVCILCLQTVHSLCMEPAVVAVAGVSIIQSLEI